MNRRKSALVCVIILFIMISALIIYIFSELYSENDIPTGNQNQDALKFKTDYEAVNGEKVGDNEVRTLSIPEDNPFIYKTEDELVEMINNKESFVVYFGFPKCPWCRSVLPSLIDAAKKNKIDKIYYVNVLDIRDTYELNDKNEAVKTKEGTKGYDKLLDLLSPILDDYAPLTYTKGKKTIKVPIDEKRIYAPNVIIVKNGNALALESGMIKSQTNGYQSISDEMKCEMTEKFNCLFEKYKSDNGTCSVGESIC